MQIVHWDADAFFASVEQAADKRLRGKPVAVGGGDRGVVCSVSYEARASGVRTAMPTRQALRLCPALILVRGHFDMYEQFSENVFERCRQLTPYVEQASIDEGYLDFRGWNGDLHTLLKTLHQVDREIQTDLKITVSQGVATNKRVAAIASKLHKPHGFTVVPAGAEAAFLAPLPVNKLPGIGPVLSTQLASLGIDRIGDLLKLGPDFLRPVLGRQTESFIDAASGVDTRPVITERAPAESFGRQETFATDRGDEEGVMRDIKRMLEVLVERVRQAGKQARTITVKVRYTDHEEQSAGRSLACPSDLAEDFHPLLPALLKQAWARRVRIRLAAVTLSHLYPALNQLELFEGNRQRVRTLTAAVDELRARYGRNAVSRASLMTPGSTPPD